jgi:hypothetical protein
MSRNSPAHFLSGVIAPREHGLLFVIGKSNCLIELPDRKFNVAQIVTTRK